MMSLEPKGAFHPVLAGSDPNLITIHKLVRTSGQIAGYFSTLELAKAALPLSQVMGAYNTMAYVNPETKAVYPLEHSTESGTTPIRVDLDKLAPENAAWSAFYELNLRKDQIQEMLDVLQTAREFNFRDAVIRARCTRFIQVLEGALHRPIQALPVLEKEQTTYVVERTVSSPHGDLWEETWRGSDLKEANAAYRLALRDGKLARIVYWG